MEERKGERRSKHTDRERERGEGGMDREREREERDGRRDREVCGDGEKVTEKDETEQKQKIE